MKIIPFEKPLHSIIIAIIVTVFWKTEHNVTNTEIHFCPYMKVTLMHYPKIPII